MLILYSCSLFAHLASLLCVWDAYAVFTHTHICAKLYRTISPCRSCMSQLPACFFIERWFCLFSCFVPLDRLFVFCDYETLNLQVFISFTTWALVFTHECISFVKPLDFDTQNDVASLFQNCDRFLSECVVIICKSDMNMPSCNSKQFEFSAASSSTKTMFLSLLADSWISFTTHSVVRQSFIKRQNWNS